MFPKILVIDDDTAFLKSVEKLLKLHQYRVTTVANSAQVEDLLGVQQFNCILLDVKMPGVNGLELLKLILKQTPFVPVIVISGHSNIRIAVEALKNGAYDFIEKPLEPERLLVTIKNALHQHVLQEEKQIIYEQLMQKFRMIGQCKAMLKVFQAIQISAKTSAKVLITGESGTGKELVAWALHHNSDRKGKPYIKVNCAAIPENLLESELFGHKRGSFTGATTDRKGKFLSANGGTLFLDEIGDMNINLQAKLLRALDQNEIEIIGANTPQKVNVRLIAATNQNLQNLIQQGKFREDLYYRLNVMQIDLPPLRERTEDIIPLSEYFLRQFCEENNKRLLTISRTAQAMLLNYSWPGNIRELRNIIEKLVIMTENPEIGAGDINKAFSTTLIPNRENLDVFPEEIVPLREASMGYEKKYIITVLNQFNWKINKTAQALKIDRSNLFKKMQKLGIEKPN